MTDKQKLAIEHLKVQGELLGLKIEELTEQIEHGHKQCRKIFWFALFPLGLLMSTISVSALLINVFTDTKQLPLYYNITVSMALGMGTYYTVREFVSTIKMQVKEVKTYNKWKIDKERFKHMIEDSAIMDTKLN